MTAAMLRALLESLTADPATMRALLASMLADLASEAGRVVSAKNEATIKAAVQALMGVLAQLDAQPPGGGWWWFNAFSLPGTAGKAGPHLAARRCEPPPTKSRPWPRAWRQSDGRTVRRGVRRSRNRGFPLQTRPW